jgi:Ribonuclease G/E
MRRCPTCSGYGRIRSPATVASTVLAEMQRAAADSDKATFQVRAAPEVVRALSAAGSIERLELVEDPSIPPDGYELSRV